MARALFVAAFGAPLLAWSWMSLESGHDAGQATLVILLAITFINAWSNLLTL